MTISHFHVAALPINLFFFLLLLHLCIIFNHLINKIYYFNISFRWFYYFQLKAIHFLNSPYDLIVNSSSEEVVHPVDLLLGMGYWSIPVQWLCVCARDFHNRWPVFNVNFSAAGGLISHGHNNIDSTATSGTAPGFKFLAGDFFLSKQASSLFLKVMEFF